MTREELFEGTSSKRILFGSFFVFGNRLQAAADSFYEEITSKQFLILIILNLFGESHPTSNEIAAVSATSHQNVKQILNKLEKKGFVESYTDAVDKRKTRVRRTEKIISFMEKYRSKEMAFFQQLYTGVSEEEIEITLRTMLKMEQSLIQFKEEGKDEKNSIV